MTQLRCAGYARFSSEKQSPLSIDDQVRKCREYADRQGWVVLESQIFSD
jgi:site-specific DNA recombinase